MPRRLTVYPTEFFIILKWYAMPVLPRRLLIGGQISWLLDEWRVCQKKWSLPWVSRPPNAGFAIRAVHLLGREAERNGLVNGICTRTATFTGSNANSYIMTSVWYPRQDSHLIRLLRREPCFSYTTRIGKWRPIPVTLRCHLFDRQRCYYYNNGPFRKMVALLGNAPRSSGYRPGALLLSYRAFGRLRMKGKWWPLGSCTLPSSSSG